MGYVTPGYSSRPLYGNPYSHPKQIQSWESIKKGCGNDMASQQSQNQLDYWG